MDQGVKIINLSIGEALESGPPMSRQPSRAAIADGVLVVVSAGNEGSVGNPLEYPADYSGVLAVGATDADGHRASFSEYGSSVSVGAPGVNIVSTAAPGSVITPGQSTYTPSTGESGTSFSAPIVAAEAALLWGVAPNDTEAQIRAAIVNSAHGYAGQGLGTGQVAPATALLAPRAADGADGGRRLPPARSFSGNGQTLERDLYGTGG